MGLAAWVVVEKITNRRSVGISFEYIILLMVSP